MGSSSQEKSSTALESFPQARPAASFRWLALVFAMSFPSFMAWLYFVFLAQPEASKGFLVLAAYVLGKIVQFGFPLLWVWSFERHRLKPALPSFRGLAFGLTFGLLAAAILLVAYYGVLRGHRLLADTPSKVLAKITEFHAETPARFLFFAAFISVAHSLMEEYYWRWWVFGELRRLLAFVPAMLLSSLAFMAHHVIILAVYLPGQFWSAAVPFSLAIAVGGAVWAWLYHRTKTIYSSWISHLLIDAAIMLVGYDLVFMYRISR
jgi:membrane protease YdiL (CAAX protease family)